MTTTPVQKFPLPFADRPGFVPRSIDPKVPMAYYPGEQPVRESPSMKTAAVVILFIALCAAAMAYGALAR